MCKTESARLLFAVNSMINVSHPSQNQQKLRGTRPMDESSAGEKRKREGLHQPGVNSKNHANSHMPDEKNKKKISSIESEKSRIEYALSMLSPASVVSILKIHANSSNLGLQKVAELLTRDLAPAEENPKALCFRCGKRYDPNYPSKCIMAHPSTEVRIVSNDQTRTKDRVNYFCELCNKRWNSKKTSYDGKFATDCPACWIGSHNPFDEEVRQREGWGNPLVLGENATDYVNSLGYRDSTGVMGKSF